MSGSPPLEVRHDVRAHRFTLPIAELEAVLDYVPLDDKTLDLRHTFVPVVLRGGGVASKLVGFVLGYARDNGLKVVPTCRFIARYIDRHPEFRTLVR
jgi:predicted GNAT family acetyltransferase